MFMLIESILISKAIILDLIQKPFIYKRGKKILVDRILKKDPQKKLYL